MARAVFLLTDFGVGGYYQGVMRGVVSRISPASAVHDLCHGVRPGRLPEAAYVLESAWDHLPEDAVVVAVVDPGVGTPRRVLALRRGGRALVAPDNGLATLVLAPDAEVRAVDRPDLVAAAPSATFHGRDVFAPVGAHLAAGGTFADLGPGMPDPVVLDGLEASLGSGEIRGSVLVIDPFGNLVTTIRRRQLAGLGDPGRLRVEVGSRTLEGLVRTFGDVSPGEPLVYLGSTDRIEVAIRDGDAARTLGVGEGAPVRVTPGAGATAS